MMQLLMVSAAFKVLSVHRCSLDMRDGSCHFGCNDIGWTKSTELCHCVDVVTCWMIGVEIVRASSFVLTQIPEERGLAGLPRQAASFHNPNRAIPLH